MAIELKKAQRTKAKLKLGVSAPSGGGKTLGSLLIAYGLMKEKYSTASDSQIWEKIAIIDTENGSGELYVGREIAGIKIGEYNAITLTPPFEADKYTQSIELCKESGIEVCIIDSVTHLWSGAGGLLEQQGAIAKRTGNSYTAWRDITPQHNHFVDTMLQTDMHIIANMRSKTDYVQEKDPNTGKTTIRKVGLNPIAKDGMEFEFTLFLDINAEHEAFASKDRTSIYDQKTFKITPQVGRDLMKWLESGTEGAKQVVATTTEHPVVESTQTHDLKDEVLALSLDKAKVNKDKVVEIIKRYEATGNPKKIKDETKLKQLKDELELITE